MRLCVVSDVTAGLCGGETWLGFDHAHLILCPLQLLVETESYVIDAYLGTESYMYSTVGVPSGLILRWHPCEGGSMCNTRAQQSYELY